MTVLVYRSSAGQDQTQPPANELDEPGLSYAPLDEPGLAEVLVMRQSLSGLSFSGSGLSGLNPLDTVMGAYSKMKASNPISTTSINTEKVLRRVVAVGAMLGGIRDTIMLGRKKNLNVEKITAGFEAQRGAVNQSMRELQEFIKGKTGKHVKMPYINPLGASEDVSFMGAEFGLFPVAMAVAAIAGIGAAVTLPIAIVKKVLSVVTGAEKYGVQSQKMMDEIVNNPDIPVEEKLKLVQEVKDTFEEQVPVEDTLTVMGKIKSKVKDLLGITAAENRVKTGLLIVGGLAAAWTVYRVVKKQPIIPTALSSKLGLGMGEGYYLGGGNMGSFGDQQSKMSGCAAKWRNSGKSGNYKSFMSSCLRGKASGLSGVLGSFSGRGLGLDGFDGFEGAFGGSGGKRRRKSKRGKRRSGFSGLTPQMKKMSGRMTSCAAKWQRSGKNGEYRQFISKCLKSDE